MRPSTSVSPFRSAACCCRSRSRSSSARRLSCVTPAGLLQVEHRLLAAAELHALMLRRQEPAAPQPRVERLIDLARRDQDDEGRQVGVVAAQPVMHPRAHARAAGDLRSGLEERDRRIVVDRLGEHRADDAQVVDDLGGVRQQVGDPGAAAAVLREPELRPGERQRRLVARHAGEPLALAHRIGQLLAVARLEQRLVIERLELRRPAGHEQVDDALGLGRHVELAAEHAAIGRACRLAPCVGCRPAAPPGPRRHRRVHQVRQRDAAEPEPNRDSTCRRDRCGAGSGPTQQVMAAAVVAHGRSHSEHATNSSRFMIGAHHRRRRREVVRAEARDSTPRRRVERNAAASAGRAREHAPAVRRTVCARIAPRARRACARSAGGRRRDAAQPASPGSVSSIRSASTRAASTNCGSFSSTSACSGVVVTSRRRCRPRATPRRT